MKNKIFIIIFLLSSSIINAQQGNIEDSLRAIINQQKNDTAEVNTLAYLANEQTQIDSRIKYAQQGLALAKKLNYRIGEADCLFVLGLRNMDFGSSIQNALGALNIYESLHNNQGIASSCLVLQAKYWYALDYKNALKYAFSGVKIAEANNVMAIKYNFPGHRLAPLFLAEIGQIYLLRNQLDSALIYTQKSIAYNELFNGAKWNFPVYLLATIQTMEGKYKPALENYRSAIPLAIQNGFPRDTLQIFSGMSTLFKKTGQLDSAIYYAQIVVQSLYPQTELKNRLEAINNLAEVYNLNGNKDSVIKYIEASQNLKDSIFSNDKDRAVQAITFNEHLKQQEIISNQISYKSKVQLYGLGAGLFILLLIAIILWRSNLHKQKARIKIEQAYAELKSTQSQLIQSEKMASLGELTAGIAHEIQNPLNFVNNFSEVNDELLKELKAEAEKGNLEEVKAIAKDIEFNSEKINHHGRRADVIVKGMLQHSRTSSGQKEPTDINALADEYLRLAYHGLKAKDKSFNATMKTDFDESIGKINIVPQDIGRVILNLINNAFYAVDEKKKQQPPSPKGEKEDSSFVYEPVVTVSTKRLGSPSGDGGKPDSYRVEIRVTDNGNGIPKKILDKIFQPFFTTKPTGQGTGLGLSLSYDIVKAHGGELKVETRGGEGSEFIITL